MHITNNKPNTNINSSFQKTSTNSSDQKSFQFYLDNSTNNTSSDNANTVHWSSMKTVNGTELQVTHDLDNLLTNTDKQLLNQIGYPNSRASQLISGRIMVDRLSGTLTGPVTYDYLFGNSTTGAKGAINSFPSGTFSSSDISSISALF